MVVIFFLSVSMPSLETICPKYAIHDLKNSHLLHLSPNPAADNFSNTPFTPFLFMPSSGIEMWLVHWLDQKAFVDTHRILMVLE